MGYFLSLSKSAASIALNISEWILLFSGLILVIGIFGEYKKLPRRLLIWPTAVFEIMVMVGVAGELIGDAAVSLFSRHLETISGLEIASLNREAGKAKESAGQANEGAAKAEENANTAIKEAAVLSLEAARLNKLAQDEMMARRKLEARIADRSVSVLQREQILKVASGGVKVKYSIVFNSTVGDREAKQYADEIANVLSDAGFKVIRSEGSIGNPQITNIWITINLKSSDDVKDQALQVKSLLTASGIQHINEFPIDFTEKALSQINRNKNPGTDTVRSVAIDPLIGQADLGLDQVGIIVGAKNPN